MPLREYEVLISLKLDDRDLEALGRRVGQRDLTSDQAGEMLRGMILAHLLEARSSLRKDYDSINDVH